MSLLPTSQFTLTKSNEHLTVIFEPKEELSTSPPLKTELKENVSRIGFNTLNENVSQKKLNRLSTAREDSSTKRPKKTLNLKSSQETAVDNFGADKLLRQKKAIGVSDQSGSSSSIFEPRGRRGSRSNSSDVKSNSPPLKRGNQLVIGEKNYKRSLSLSTGDAKRDIGLKHSPKIMNIPEDGNSHLILPIDGEQPSLSEGFIHEMSYAIPSLLHKLGEACYQKQFTKTLSLGKEIENNLHILQETITAIKDSPDSRRLITVVNQLFLSCTASYFYQKYESYKAEVKELANSSIKSRKIASTILAGNLEGNQTRTKEVYINAILERGVSQCSALIPLISTNKQSLQTVFEIHKRIKRLLEYAKKHGAPDEYLYYCSRTLKALDFLETNAFDPSDKIEILPKTEIDIKPISILKTLTGVLESELFHIQQEQATVLSKRLTELKKLHEVIKNLDPQLKLHISNDRTSLEPKSKKGKSKRFSGTSSNARQTMEFILGKILEFAPPNAKINLLISEIVGLIDKNSWMKAILMNDSNRALDVQFESIKQSLIKTFQLEPNRDSNAHAEFWETLLDIPADPIFHKKFITSHHKFSGILCSKQNLSSTEQLFNALNEKFAQATPYQQKQILQLAIYWLQSPLQIGLRNPHLPVEIYSDEMKIARPLIKSLIEQVKNNRCLALYETALQLKTALKNCVVPMLLKPDLIQAVSPNQLLESIVKGTCTGSKYNQALTDLCKTLRTLCMYDYLNISHTELHKPPEADEHKTSIAALTKYSSFLSYWVLESIFRTNEESTKKVDLKAIDLKEKINVHDNRSIERMIEFFIDVVMHLVDEKTCCAASPADYHSAFAIYLILAKPHVQKLFKESEPVLKISRKHLNKFNELATLFDANKTFLSLRKKYDKVPFHIPALNFICRDLTTSLDSDLVPLIDNEQINIQAVNWIGASTMAISQSQSSLDYSNACVFNLPAEFYRIEKTKAYSDISNKFDCDIFDDVFYSIIHGIESGQLQVSILDASKPRD